jgi:hypothetical protein
MVECVATNQSVQITISKRKCNAIEALKPNVDQSFLLGLLYILLKPPSL